MSKEILIPIIRQYIPALFAENIVSVQPMQEDTFSNLFKISYDTRTDWERYNHVPFGAVLLHDFIKGWMVWNPKPEGVGQLIQINEFIKQYGKDALLKWNKEANSWVSCYN